MRSKSIVTLAFIIVIAFISAYVIFSGGKSNNLSAEESVHETAKTNQPEMEKAAQNASATEPTCIIAYYFHAARRCTTCRTIEAYTAEALKEEFGDALKSGKMEWRVLDVSVPENKHFVDDYQLVTQSVVLSAVQDGKQTKWKNLNKVWQLVRNKDAFFSYVQNETADFMKE